MVEALVEFDYTAQAPDELTLKKGDVITAIKTEPGNGWWEGNLKGHRGLFPDNFVKVLTKDAPGDSGKDEKNGVLLRSNSKRRCRAVFSYKPVNDDELELKVNDLIEVLAEVEEGWWKGKLRNKVGVFPSNFVQEEALTESVSGDISEKSIPKTKADPKRSSIPNVEETLNPSPGESQSHVVEAQCTGNEVGVPSLPPKPAKEYCRVLFPYEAANEDELTLTKGDTVLVLSKVVQDRGWWKGELKGKIGVFPDNFVELIPADVGPKKADRQSSSSSTADAGTKAIMKTEQAHPPDATTSHTEPIESPSKAEDKPQVPPVPGKKPQLPPPLKKPQRLPPGHPPSVQTSSASAASGLSAIKRISGEFEAWGATGDTPDGAKMSSMSKSNSHITPISAVRLRRIDGTSSSTPAISDNVGNLPPSGEMDFDSVERSAMLSHPTASRAKAPRRRPPSAMFPGKESEGGGLMNGTIETEDTVGVIVEAPRTLVENGAASEDNAKESDSATATANGGSEDMREKKSPAGATSRPPFMEELKMSQAKRGNPMSSSVRSVTVQPSTVQVVSSSTTPPRPLLTQPPNPYAAHGVHVHQGGAASEASERVSQLKQQQRPFQSRTEEVDSSSNPSTAVELPSIAPLALKEVSPKKPPRRGRKSVENDGCSLLEVSDGDGDMVMDEISVVGSVRSTTVITGASHVAVSPAVADAASTVVLPSSVTADSSIPLTGSSRMPIGDGPTPTALTRRPVSAYAADLPSHRRVAAHFSSWQEPVSDGDSVTVTPQMYKELRERVELLEQSLESQSERFTQMLNQLKEELGKERERRKVLQDSVNQLQSLLTHV